MGEEEGRDNWVGVKMVTRSARRDAIKNGTYMHQNEMKKTRSSMT